MAELSTSPTSSTSSVEISDALFCQHGKEVCSQCQFDGREDNNTFYGVRCSLSHPSWP
ncbi:hypothetical protein CALVIDRAFT_535151 [Calocera viscosa TUFC12733]|uniref:Uncharacterized protein n=1 Tax=Calocera viscosa (strain TUFC12733) TaxID=1330018 RepID=A0A167P835_CALVF|nr:hypothetical protein CALVIDRAFT_535151 [Calocera viscosa TUFC12733]